MVFNKQSKRTMFTAFRYVKPLNNALGQIRNKATSPQELLQ